MNEVNYEIDNANFTVIRVFGNKQISDLIFDWMKKNNENIKSFFTN